MGVGLEFPLWKRQGSPVVDAHAVLVLCKLLSKLVESK